MSSKDTHKRIKQLQKLIAHHRNRYHTDDTPEISDEVYDSLVTELQRLEGSTDETIGSQTTVVGGAVSEAFSKVTHPVRQWSFSNVFSLQELQDWEDRLYRFLDTTRAQTKISYVAEHKIDGLKVILTYKEGALVRAATRGNGIVGEDVTHTVRTISDVPHTITKKVDIVCVGEVWLSQKEFERINAAREKETSHSSQIHEMPLQEHCVSSMRLLLQRESCRCLCMTLINIIHGKRSSMCRRHKKMSYSSC